MKKTLILIIIAIVAILLVSKFSNEDKKTDKVEIMQTVPKPDPSNATFNLDDGPVTLNKGKSSESIGTGRVSIDTTLTDTLTYGDINNDGKNDTALILLQSGGGSGIFVYVAAYVSGNVEYKGSNAIFIGDRISPKDLKISDSGIITLEYLDRKPGEPMAAEPTILTSKNFIYRSGKLEER